MYILYTHTHTRVIKSNNNKIKKQQRWTVLYEPRPVDCNDDLQPVLLVGFPLEPKLLLLLLLMLLLVHYILLLLYTLSRAVTFYNIVELETHRPISTGR